MNIGHRLAIYGWLGETDEYLSIMIKVWKGGYEERFVTIERLLYNPIEALRYVDEVRLITKVFVPTEEVLHTLNNLRKADKL